MDDSEKPFACSSPGCNMSFTNEDHLVVHKKKHDMILNFGTGGKNGVFVADQTPTPTRFIRTCEEVGLFQDLQNVNPFEETFRRAVESGKIGTLPDSELGINDDTLHTPHVFPHIHDNDLKTSSCNTVDSEVEGASDTLNHDVTVKNKIDDDTSKKSVEKTVETIVIQEADTSIIQASTLTSTPNLSINGEEVQLFFKTQDGSMVQLSAIPICHVSPNIPCSNENSNNNNNSSSNNNNNNQTQQSKSQLIVPKSVLPLKNSETAQIKNSSSSRLSLAKARLRQALTKNETRNNKIHRVSQHSRNINEKTVESGVNKNEKYLDLVKKQEILERNRASSMRARAKRKEWIQQLEKKVKNVNTLNATLQLEIKSLQTEVTKLKTILLAHKDCPVTKVMEKGNGIIVKSKIIPLQTPQFIQSTPITSNYHPNTIHGIKRNLINNDIPIGAKKQPLILPTKTKQTILLPKASDKLLPIVTKIYHKNPDTMMMKLIDFTNINDNNKQTKMGDEKFLILQNGSNSDGIPTKIQVINPQEIVNVDQSLQLINVASKTTGT